MKKHININFVVAATVATLIVAQVALGQLFVGGMSMFSASASPGTSTVILPAQSGQIALQNVSYTFNSASATYNHYRPDVRLEVSSAANTSTSLVVFVDADGKVNGFTPGSSDYVIISGSVSNSGNQLRSVTTVGNVTTNAGTYSRSLGLTATCIAATNDPVFLARSGNIISRTVTAAANDALYQGAGVYGYPYAITLVSTGATTLAGTYVIYR